jgi:hypothetical protein
MAIGFESPATMVHLKYICAERDVVQNNDLQQKQVADHFFMMIMR